MKGMVGLEPLNDDEEKEIILALLNNNHTLEVYIDFNSIDIYWRAFVRRKIIFYNCIKYNL